MKQKWNNYIDFRNYLNAFPEKAMKYDECKQNLAKKFSDTTDVTQKERKS